MSAPRFTDHRDVSQTRGVLVGALCGLALWGLLYGFAVLLTEVMPH